MELLNRQYKAFKKLILNDYPYELEINDNELFTVFKEIYNDVCRQHSKIENKYFSNQSEGIIDFKYLDHYLIFCFRMANYIYKNGINLELADAIYYSSRIRTGTDLYYTANIDEYFFPVHSIGAIIDSHTEYGKLFRVYHGVHVGPYNIQGVDPKDQKHPKIGNGVILLGKSSVYGDSQIGDNVIVSVGSVVINEKIPSNCIVIGQSPNLYVLPNKCSNFDLLKIE